jgi:hypothetical protein
LSVTDTFCCLLGRSVYRLFQLLKSISSTCRAAKLYNISLNASPTAWFIKTTLALSER